MQIPYVNLKARSEEVREELLDAAARVLDSGHYILGPELEAFESEFAAYCGTSRAIGVDNGTSALHLTLKALGIGPGDEVITVANSFLATAAAVCLVGAKPVFVDIGEDLNIDINQIEKAISPDTKAIMPVHLTGRPANMLGLQKIAKIYNLVVIEDAAQAVGAQLKGQTVGSFGLAAGFSLHPLKNLHAFGDAGIITTSNLELADYLLQARNHGFRNRNETDFWSFNCRLDEIQAAMLRVQLKNLDTLTEIRRKIAKFFNTELRSIVQVPDEEQGEKCVYQTYVIQAPERGLLAEFLIKNGIDIKIHYPIPIYQQKPAQDLGYSDSDLPQSAAARDKILSLPCYPALTDDQVNFIVEKVKEFYEG